MFHIKCLNYLSGLTGMEIKTAGNCLFKLTADNSQTYCCRVDSSKDLVIADENFQAAKFCISGAELQNHPAKVYLSYNKTMTSLHFTLMKTI